MNFLHHPRKALSASLGKPAFVAIHSLHRLSRWYLSQPAAIFGTREILPKEQWAPRRGGVVEVRFGPAIATAGRSGAPARRALAAETRAAFLALGVPDGAVIQRRD